MDKIKVYSPRQVFLGSWLGGPLASTYFLAKNASNLGQGRKMFIFIIGGTITSAVVMTVAWVVTGIPSIILPLCYSSAANALASSRQMTKLAILTSETHTFQSSWKVLGVSVIGLVALTAATHAVIFGLDAAGLIDLSSD